MARRQRLTWRSKQASPPPATPSEVGSHPGYHDDPEMDDYRTGDPSSWAEDPHPGPYPNSPPPQTPSETGEAHLVEAHLVKKADKCLEIAESMMPRSASDKEVEDKALQIMLKWDDTRINRSARRLASKTERPSRNRPARRRDRRAATKRRSVTGFDARKAQRRSAQLRPERPRSARLDRDEMLLQKMLREERTGRRASRPRKARGEDEEAMLDRMLLAQMIREEKSGRKARYTGQDLDMDGIDQNDFDYDTEVWDYEDEDEMLLGQMLEEEEFVDEDEALLARMIAEEEEVEEEDEEEVEEARLKARMRARRKAQDEDEEDLLARMIAEEEDVEEVDEVEEAMFKAMDDEDDMEAMACGRGAYEDAAELDIQMDPLEDPMDLSGSNQKLASSDKVLEKLFMASEDEDEDEDEEGEEEEEEKEEEEGEEEEEEKEEKEAKKKKARSRTAGLRPRSRKPSQGVKTLGGGVRTASNRGGDVLEKLWSKAPDVSGAFD